MVCDRELEINADLQHTMKVMEACRERMWAEVRAGVPPTPGSATAAYNAARQHMWLLVDEQRAITAHIRECRLVSPVPASMCPRLHRRCRRGAGSRPACLCLVRRVQAVPTRALSACSPHPYTRQPVAADAKPDPSAARDGSAAARWARACPHLGLVAKLHWLCRPAPPRCTIQAAGSTPLAGILTLPSCNSSGLAAAAVPPAQPSAPACKPDTPTGGASRQRGLRGAGGSSSSEEAAAAGGAGGGAAGSEAAPLLAASAGQLAAGLRRRQGHG